MWCLWLVCAQAGTTFVDARLIALERTGDALDWHPNVWAGEVVVRDDGTARVALDDDSDEVCQAKTTGSSLDITCGDRQHAFVVRDGRFTATLSWGDLTLVKYDRNVQQIMDDARRALSMTVLAPVEGTFTRATPHNDKLPTTLTIHPSTIGSLWVAPCIHGNLRTVCVHQGYEAWVLQEDGLHHATVHNDNGGPFGIVAQVDDDLWTRPDVCAGGSRICAIRRNDVWIPFDTARQGSLNIDSTESLAAGRIRPVHGTGVVRTTMRARGVLQAAVLIEFPVELGDIAVSPWVALVDGQLPEQFDMPRVGLKPSDRRAHLQTGQSCEYCDAALEALATCPDLASPPCVSAPNAVDVEVSGFDAAGKVVDKVTLRVEKSFEG